MRPNIHITLRKIAALLTIVVLSCETSLAQSSKDSSLIIGTIATDPGTSASLPVYFKPAAGQKLRKIHLEVEFVSNSIRFTKAEKGVATQGQDYDLNVSVQALPPDEKNVKRTRLAIDFSLPDSAPGKGL